MKRSALVLFALLAMTGSAVAFKNEPKGFRGITWGTSFEAVQDQMSFLTDEDAHTKRYQRANDNMGIGGASMQSLA
jgi:hypothetical protein